MPNYGGTLSSLEHKGIIPLRASHFEVKIRIPEIMLVAEILAYSAIFSYLTVLKFQAFGMYAWDLGVYHQAFYTTVTSGDLFFSTVEWPYTQTVVPKGTIFGVHFSPFLFLLLPFYALFQSPIALLVIKSIGIAIGAVPVYLLSKKELGSSTLGLVFSTSYLLLPALQEVNWYDFQPHAFLPMLLLFTLFYMERRQIKFTLFFLILALSTIEIAPFLGIGIGLSSLVLNRKSIVEMFRKHEIIALLKSMPFAIILVSCAWLAIVYLTLVFFGWQGSFHLSNMRRVSALSTFSLVEALSFDWQAKVLYILLIFGPLAFLSFLDLPRVFPASFWMFVAIFSNYSPFYSISFQYPSFVIPFVMYSSIFGFKKLYTSTHQKRKCYLSILLGFAVTSSAMIGSPLGSIHLGSHPWAGPYGIPTVSKHDIFLQNLIDLIPKNSSVLTQNNIFPHISDRKEAYVFPFSSTFKQPGDFQLTMETYFQKAEFILIDGTRDPVAATVALSIVSKSKDFGVFAEADGSILLKRGYNGPAVLFIPYEATFTRDNLVIKSGQIIEDTLSRSKKVLYRNSSEPSGDFWYGPGVFLARGNYSVNFRIKMSSNMSSNAVSEVIVLAVCAWPTVVTFQMMGSESMWFMPTVTVSSSRQECLVAKHIQSSDFVQTNEYQTFSLQFYAEKPGRFEFVGLSARTGFDIYLDYIELIQISP